jgi:hypothetical protein
MHEYPDYKIIHLLARRVIPVPLGFDRHIIDYGDYLTVEILHHSDHFDFHHQNSHNYKGKYQRKHISTKQPKCPKKCPDNCQMVCP